MMVIYADVRACQFCSKGAREWFKRFGFDYLDFVKNGLAAETLLATGDPFALRAIEQAKKRVGADNGK